jgi:RNA-directed DNA polymerase
LTLNQEKTHITHWQKRLRFLGYHLEGRRNPNGTGWLHLSIPKEAVRNVVSKIQRATTYSQAPEFDVFTNVNAVARGWSNYYRYAHDNNVVGGKLSTVIYWRTAHDLGKKHKCSIAKIMRKQYDRSLKTGCKGLYTYKPGKPATPENRYFIWHKTLPRLSLASVTTYSTNDQQAYIDTGWAKGRSRHKRHETQEQAERQCQNCGTFNEELFVHHPKRLINAKRVKKGSAYVAQAGLTQQTKLLCYSCHLAHHHGNPRQ